MPREVHEHANRCIHVRWHQVQSFVNSIKTSTYFTLL